MDEPADVSPGSACAAELPIEDLPNLGAKSARLLRSVGITTLGDLEREGPVAAYVRARHVWEGASLNLLWAMVAGLRGVPWTQLGSGEKAAWKAQIDAFELAAGAEPVSPSDPPPRG